MKYLPQAQEFDRAAFLMDKYAFTRWARHNQLDDAYFTILLDTLERAKIVMCTPMQRAYMYEYFTNRLTMLDIASLYGVNKSTVSRTISRGIVNVAKVMYCLDSRFGSVVERFSEGPRERRKKALNINKHKQ